MRISLIHGNNSSISYSKYRDLINQSKIKDFKIIEISDLKNIVNQSLFEDKIVFTLNKPNKIKLNDWKWFSKNASKYNSNLLVYYEGDCPATILKLIPKDAKIEKFDLPKIIFTFLDSFWPGNSQPCLKLLNELIINEPIELVFHLLSQRIRDLYWAKNSKETLTIPEWRTLKLTSQADKFKDLKKVINKLAEIDMTVKNSETDLKTSLDILIAQELK
jgi:hypothetical protein